MLAGRRVVGGHESMNGGWPNKSFLLLLSTWSSFYHSMANGMVDLHLYLVLNKLATSAHLPKINVLCGGVLNANCLNVNFHSA